MTYALPTDLNIIQSFETTLLGGFSCFNTRLAFDTKVLLPNLLAHNLNQLTIDQTFKIQIRHGLKVGCRVELDVEESYSNPRIINKILKMDQDNNYRQTMTKPFSMRCSKEEKNVPSLEDFILPLKSKHYR